MTPPVRQLLLRLVGLAVLLFPTLAGAVVFYSNASPTHNSTAPTGTYASAGWQYLGRWQAFVTVPIGPRHFIAASHIGGSIGDVFTYQGIGYTTIAKTSAPDCDLTIWEVDKPMPSWATLNTSTFEADEVCFFYGRGGTRGTPVTVGGALRGWQWGPGAASPQWGVNRIASTPHFGAPFGDMLYATFDAASGLAEEAHLAGGDSSAPIFIKVGTQWVLAGVAYGVDSKFNTTDIGPGFDAALFNVQGLYYGSEGYWTLITDPVPSGFYATRISSHLDWINGVLAAATSGPVPGGADVPALPLPALLALGTSVVGLGCRYLRK